MTDSTRTPVTPDDAAARVAQPWQVVGDTLQADYKTGTMVRGGQFVGRIIDAAEDANHHPDVDLRYPSVHLSLTTHSAGCLTEADVELAGRIAEIAGELDLDW